MIRTALTLANEEHVELLSLADLTQEEAAEFDYIGDEDSFSPRIARYRGTLIDVNETEGPVPNTLQFSVPGKYLHYRSDSFFSGVLIGWHEECPQDYEGHEYTEDSWDCVTIVTYLV